MSAVPRSLFAFDGTMNLCSSKSKLISILQALELPTEFESEMVEQDHTLQPTSIMESFSVAIVDGMAELQALDKKADITTCEDLGRAFTSKMNNKYQHYDEVHIVFDDSYNADSIKNLTRSKRLQGTNANEYKIMDNTDIHNINMKKLLSHIRTKDALTDYLAHKLLQHAHQTSQKYVVAWRAEAAASHCAVDFLSSTQEEADTKIILHAVNAKERGATRLDIFAQDTDVIVLAVRRYPELPRESFFVPSIQNKISIRRIFMSLGALKSSALPAFHALSGCDTTGSLVGKGKLSYWKVFNASNEKMLQTLASLGTSETVSEHVARDLESFICRVYRSDTKIKTLAALRWWMFTTKQTLGDKMPPFTGAFLPALNRVNFQAMVWEMDKQSRPNIPSPVGHGWIIEDGLLTPVMCDLPCAPESIMKLVRCSCLESKCNASCKCRANGLPCTEMCNCTADDEMCENVSRDHTHDLHDEDSSDSDDNEQD